MGTKLQYCRIQLPGRPSGFNLHENSQKTADYWYEGSGLNSGQCGIGIAHIKDEHNGIFQCTMGTLQGSEELVGTTNVTVASKFLHFYLLSLNMYLFLRQHHVFLNVRVS